MASANAEVPQSAQVVGDAFVVQYYHILHHSPELAYQFYQDGSFLGRPLRDGIMTVATTVKSINDVISSLDYKSYQPDIETVDAQYSSHGGVVLLVTGSLTGNDHHKRKFTQTFFLAPQETGYYILNDVFRYVDDKRPGIVSELDIGIDATLSHNFSQFQEPAQLIEHPQSGLSKPLITTEVVEEVENGLVIDVKLPSPDKDIVVESESHSNGTHAAIDCEVVNSVSEDDAPKKSYACIVSSQTKRMPQKVYVPANKAREALSKDANQSVIQPSEVSNSDVSSHPTPVPSSEVPSNPTPVIAPENKDIPHQDESHSIYIGNLPVNATISHLEAEFRKFGLINPDGIQVISNIQQGFCFGFVSFKEFGSKQRAIEASPIMIGGRQAIVKEKTSTSRVGSGRSRFPSGRGGFRDGAFRGPGNLNNRKVYVRTDNFRNNRSFEGHRGDMVSHQSSPVPSNQC